MSIFKTADGYTQVRDGVDLRIGNENSGKGNCMNIHTYLGNGGYNGFSTEGDIGIIYGIENYTDEGKFKKGFCIVAHNGQGIRINNDGKVNALSFNPTSDYRIKKNVEYLDDTYTSIHLKPIKYINKNNKEYMGFLAHEVQSVYPCLVNGEKDAVQNDKPIYQSLNYTGIIPLMVNDIKMMNKKIDFLKRELSLLQNISKCR